MGERRSLACYGLKTCARDDVPEQVDEGRAQTSLMRCKLEIVESQVGEEVVDSGDMGGGFGVEDDSVVRDTVHETLEGSRSVRISHERGEPLGEALWGKKCSELG